MRHSQSRASKVAAVLQRVVVFLREHTECLDTSGHDRVEDLAAQKLWPRGEEQGCRGRRL